MARLLLNGWQPASIQMPNPIRRRVVNYTHYDYLELAPGAASHRIEAAYCALLERFQYGHTDAGQDLSGLVRMIHAAYSVLSDPDQRRAYDAALTKEAEAADAELQSQLDAAALTGFTRVQQVPETLLAMLPELAA
jgi:DnaJ-class molecular chaperone